MELTDPTAPDMSILLRHFDTVYAGKLSPVPPASQPVLVTAFERPKGESARPTLSED